MITDDDLESLRLQAQFMENNNPSPYNKWWDLLVDALNELQIRRDDEQEKKS